MQDVRICPSCGSNKVRVIDTGRKVEQLERRRKCIDCGYEYRTVEILQRDFSKIEVLEIKAKKNEKLEQLDKMLKECYGR